MRHIGIWETDTTIDGNVLIRITDEVSGELILEGTLTPDLAEAFSQQITRNAKLARILGEED